MDNKNCKPCYGISCPHWPTCFPEMRSDIKELDGKIEQLQSENKRLKEVLRDIADHVCPKIYSPTCPEIAQQALPTGETEMSRDIRFRAWDKAVKVMFYSDDCYFVFQNGKLLERDGINGDVIEANIIMQFTGLKDKNGKEIYEGDICKNGDWEPDAHAYNYRIEEIRWDIDNGLWLGSNYNCDGMTCEVIGNIHENPELLEEKPK